MSARQEAWTGPASARTRDTRRGRLLAEAMRLTLCSDVAADEVDCTICGAPSVVLDEARTTMRHYCARCGVVTSDLEVRHP